VKVTDVKAVYPRWRHLPEGAWQSHFWQIVVRVETDAGVVGLGYGGGGDPAVAVVNQHMRELLVGRSVDSVDDIRDAWDWLYYKSLPYGRTGIPVMALSGIDLALWDLLGKAQGRPVYDLLGGLEVDRVRAYASSGDFERDRDAGYTAVKVGTAWYGRDGEADETVESVAGAREAYGPEALVMTDCGMTWNAADALEMARRLADYDVYWFEDVLTPDDLEELAGLRPGVKPVLLAGGEHDYTHHSFAAIARSEALDLWQPDITWCGGITAGLRIVELARGAGVPVVPHRGGEIWGLHLLAATGCGELAETMPHRWTPPNDELWLDEPRAKDGFIAPLDRPGFGVVLNEAML
jgi:L-rhamnonate dehydratase